MSNIVRSDSLSNPQPSPELNVSVFVKENVAAELYIEHVVAHAFNVTVADIRSSTRGLARAALARQVAMYLLHVCYGISLTQVGAQLGRDRTTVAHACRVVENLRDDRVFDESLTILENAFSALVSPAFQQVSSIYENRA